MKEKLMNNLVIKLLSVPLAIMIWIVIMNLDDPVKTKTIYNVPVEIKNADTITSANKVYDIVEGTNVTVRVKAKQSVLEKIKHDDILVTADLAQITQFNKVELDASCPKYDADNTIEVTAKPKMLTVALEESDTISKTIQVDTKGNVASGYSLGVIEAVPNMIEITGAKSTIERIAEVHVSVSVSGQYEDFTERGLKPIVKDEDGKEIDSSRLVFSSPNIKVNVGIVPTRTIPITITTEGEPAFGYSVTQISYDPSEITVAGKKKFLAKISSIPIKIDISGQSMDIEQTIDLTGYLPEGVKLAEGDESAVMAVRITIQKLSTKEITLGEDDIEILNVPEGFAYKYRSSGLSLRVVIMGEEEKLAGITASDLKAYIDLDGLAAGQHSVEVQFQLPDKVFLYNQENLSKVVVILEEPTADVPEDHEDEGNDENKDDNTEDNIIDGEGTDTEEEPSQEPSPEPSGEEPEE